MDLKASRYNLRRDLEDRFEDQDHEFYDEYKYVKVIPEIPEEFKPFITVGDSEDDDGNPIKCLNWDDYRGVLIYKVEEVRKTQYGD